MSNEPQIYSYTVQYQQIVPQFVQGVMTFFMLVGMALWVLQQGIKVFKGEDIEKPF